MMKMILNVKALAVGAALIAASAAHAGPGGGGGGHGGGGMGMGMGGMGMGDMGHPGGDPFGMHGGMGQGNGLSERPGIGSSSSTSVLNNTHVTGALTEALTKSGIVLPKGGLNAACGGFHNLGQCVAALHVANNLNLAGGFDALKPLVTGSSAMSLGKAIQQLSPNADAKAQEKTAMKQAKADLATVTTA